MADPTVKAIQERLAAKGLYRGKIDGIMGQGTAQALAIESSMTPPKTGPSDNEVKLKELELQAESQKNDPTGRITRMLTDVAPLLGGAALGTAIGTSRANKFKAAVREVKRDAPNLQRTAEAMARSRSASSAHVQAALGDAAKSMRNVRSGGVGGLCGQLCRGLQKVLTHVTEVQQQRTRKQRRHGTRLATSVRRQV